MGSGIEKRLAELSAQIQKLLDRADSDMRELLTIGEAAKRLSISPTTLKAMVRVGRITTTVANRRTMIPASEVTRIASPPGTQLLARGVVERKRSGRGQGASEARKIREALGKRRR